VSVDREEGETATVRTTAIRTTAAAVLLSAAALTMAGCSTSLQGPANPTDTPTTSYGPPVTTTQAVPSSGASDTNVTGTNTSEAPSSGGAPLSPTDTTTPSGTGA
jgi:hypothetical protein